MQDVKWKLWDEVIGYNDLTSICIKYDSFIGMNVDDVLVLVTKNNRYLLDSVDSELYARNERDVVRFANYSIIVNDIAYILEFTWEDNSFLGEGGDRVLIALDSNKTVIGNDFKKAN